jgi:hypothetical protein
MPTGCFSLALDRVADAFKLLYYAVLERGRSLGATSLIGRFFLLVLGVKNSTKIMVEMYWGSFIVHF